MAAKSEEKITLSVSELHDLFDAWTAQKEAEEKKSEPVAEDPAVLAWLDEKVPLMLFRDGRDYRDDVYVAINGTRMQIKRGERVMVPRKIAMVIEESNRLNNQAADRQRYLSDSLMGII